MDDTKKKMNTKSRSLNRNINNATNNFTADCNNTTDTSGAVGSATTTQFPEYEESNVESRNYEVGSIINL